MLVYNAAMREYDATMLKCDMAMLNSNHKCKQNFEMSNSCLFADWAWLLVVPEESSSSCHHSFASLEASF